MIVQLKCSFSEIVDSVKLFVYKNRFFSKKLKKVCARNCVYSLKKILNLGPWLIYAIMTEPQTYNKLKTFI